MIRKGRAKAQPVLVPNGKRPPEAASKPERRETARLVPPVAPIAQRAMIAKFSCFVHMGLRHYPCGAGPLVRSAL
jgi:hypothetical protein